MALEDFQMSYRGLVFGKGTPYRISKVDGLESLQVRTGDLALPRADGDLRGLDTVAPRDVKMIVSISGESRSAEFAERKAALLAAFNSSRSTDFKLGFKDPEYPERFVWGRVLDRDVPRVPDFGFGYQPVLVRIKAVDPRIYSATLKSKTLTVYSASGGGSDEVDYPVNFQVDGTAEAIINNAGDADAYPLLRFYGPLSGTVDGVEVTNTTTGKSVELDASVLGGQILEADMRRIVTASTSATPFINLDGSNRFGNWVLPRIPLALVPGDNSLRFEVTGTSTDALCVASVRDTWL